MAVKQVFSEKNRKGKESWKGNFKSDEKRAGAQSVAVESSLVSATVARIVRTAGAWPGPVL